ncbi:MAG: hypothetical protein GXP63_02275 [DPANN group archaeon]|nr:hypothetical protein [DPANN group archaeon]
MPEMQKTTGPVKAIAFTLADASNLLDLGKKLLDQEEIQGAEKIVQLLFPLFMEGMTPGSRKENQEFYIEINSRYQDLMAGISEYNIRKYGLNIGN